MPFWKTEPHTLAKITILRKYLDAWFPIVGKGFPDRGVFYIDGFAGPGRYAGGEAGSPIVSLEAAEQAIVNGTNSGHWRAGELTCIFIDTDSQTLESLQEQISAVSDRCSHVRYRIFLHEFDAALGKIQSDYRNPFGSSPVFVFVDPFGPTGLSFDTVAGILNSRSCEVLLHFDADGAARMVRALDKGFNHSSRASLNRVFGGDSWTAVSTTANAGSRDFEQITRELVKLYLSRIRTVARYAFPFQMITPSGRHQSAVGYYLIMATNHHLGLEKMKAVMKSVGQDGQYRFSNFLSRQPLLFDPPASKASDADSLLNHFVGQKGVTWPEIIQFTLNETDLISPKTMLKLLEDRSMIGVHLTGTTLSRRRSTYLEKTYPFLRFDFPEGGANG